MKLRKMLYGLILLMLGCFVLASCVNDEEGPCLPDGKTEVLFSLILQDNAQATTRTGDEIWQEYSPTDPGVEFDNYIDLDNVQMLLFTAAGNYVGKLGDLTYSKSGENIYQYIGTAPKDANQQPLSSGEYKFVVLANCDDANLTVGTSKIADLNTKAFNLFADSGNTRYIPMWGVLKANLTLVAGNRQHLGTIDLLRAMSKVTVKFSEDAEEEAFKGYSFQKITLSNYNKSGYITPTGADTTVVTTNLNLDASLHAYSSAGTNKVFESTEEGATELTFYLAEFANSTTTPAVLTVTLTKQEGTTTRTFEAPIQFCEYENGAPKAGATLYNIIRNHYYQFDIYKVTEASLWVEPTILPWTIQSEHDYTTGITVRLGTLNDNDRFLRYDEDKDFDSWAGSYIAAAYSELTTTNPAPLYSPPLRLVSNSKTPLYLHIDNPYFRFIKHNEDTGTNMVLDPETDIRIEPGNQTTIFYVVPIENYNDAEANARECHLSLISGDSTSGLAPERVPLRSSLPGFAAGTDEVWFYWIGSTVWQNYQTEEGWSEYLKMYPDDF